MNYAKKDYTYCKLCDKRVFRPVDLCWTEKGICPQCIAMKSIPDINYKDDALIRKEINPVDMYWHQQTIRVLGKGFY